MNMLTTITHMTQSHSMPGQWNDFGITSSP